jgi:hypothetical protein
VVTFLDEELEVDIIRLGCGALGLLVPPTSDEVDTLRHHATSVIEERRGKTSEMTGGERRGSHHGCGGARFRPEPSGTQVDTAQVARWVRD